MKMFLMEETTNDHEGYLICNFLPSKGFINYYCIHIEKYGKAIKMTKRVPCGFCEGNVNKN